MVQSPRECSSCWTAAVLGLAGQANSTGKENTVQSILGPSSTEQSTQSQMSGVLGLQSLQQIHLSEVRIYIWLKKLRPRVGQVLTPLLTCLETWDCWEMEIWSFPFACSLPLSTQSWASAVSPSQKQWVSME